MFSSKRGMSSYKGYEYQIYVSIWTALFLIFKEKKCKEIIIEPATEEDIAANLDVDSCEVITTLQFPMPTKPLQIQVKLRSGGPLDVSEFVNIISNDTSSIPIHGSKSRKRPIQLLNEDTELIYTLITTSEVNKNLKPYVIENIGDISLANTTNSPKSIIELQGANKDELLQRIGILEQRIPRLLLFEIKDYLAQHCHVPTTKHNECIEELVAHVRDRLLGLRAREWTEDEIRQVIYKHSGFSLVNKTMSSFVKPSNYSCINEHLKKHNKVLIIGPPGIGKTLTADMLEYEYSTSSYPYEVIKKEVGIGGIKDYLKKPGRYLFYIEDPWGNNSISNEAAAWMSELPKLLERASEDKKFLITSRGSILDQAAVSKRSLDVLQDDCILITPDNYDKGAREEILLKKIIQLRSWQKDIVTINRNKILDKLTVPISLERFAALLEKESDENKVKIDQLIQKSLVESIQSTLVEEICNLSQDAISSSIALWVLGVSGEEVNIESIRFVRKAIKEKYQSYELDIQKLVYWMEKARWIYTKGHNYYMHPTTLSGLEEIVKQNDTKAEDIISSFLESLIEKNKHEWAFNIITKLKDRVKMIPNEVSDIIRRYLIRKLVCSSDADYSQNFYRVALWTSGEDAITLITKGLATNEKRDRWNHGFIRWEYPNWDEKQLNEIKSSEQAYSIARKFVRLILPSTHSVYGEDLIGLFHRLDWDFSIECQDLLETCITTPTMNDQTIVKLALMNKSPAYDKVLNIILSELSNTEKWWNDSVKEYNSALQAELDFEHINHIMEEPNERFSPVESALKIVVNHRRERYGYLWILQSEEKEKYVKPWAESIYESNKLVTKEELEALVDLCDQYNAHLAWKCIEKSQCKELANVLFNALKTCSIDNIEHCLQALCQLLSSEEVGNGLNNMKESLNLTRKIYIVITSKSIDYSDRFEAKEIYIENISKLLNSEELGFIECIEKILENKEIDIKEEYISYLKEWIVEAPELQASFVINALAKQEYDISDTAHAILNSAKNFKARYNVLITLASLKNERAHQMIVAALSDEDFNVRELAIRILENTQDLEEKLAIISKHTDRSAPVREACAQVIGDMQWEEGIEVLYRLLYDKRNVGAFGESKNFDNDTNYHVARAAAQSLSKFSALPIEVIENLIDFVNGGKKKSDDIVVHYRIIGTLSNHNHPKVIDFLQKIIQNNWFMSGYKNSGFPLRYAAAWGILFQVDKYPENANSINTSVIVEAAKHSDVRLAAPALIILGLLNMKNIVGIRDVLQHYEITPDRIILILATFMVEGVELPNEFYSRILPESYAGRKVLEFLSQGDSIADKTWSDFIEENDDVKEWVKLIETEEGIAAYLVFVINQLVDIKGFKPLKELYVRKNELAENIGSLNLYSIFGGK